MKDGFFNSRRGMLFLISGSLVLFTLAALITLYLSARRQDPPHYLQIHEIPMKVTYPRDYSTVKINENDRRGSFAAYRFQGVGNGQNPTLLEIQFFTGESIETFIRDCGGDSACFYSSYPNPTLYANLQAAFEAQNPFDAYSLKMYNDQYFLVQNIPCHGLACTIREYVTFFDDVMAIIWINMDDETQSERSNQLFSQVIFAQSQ